MKFNITNKITGVVNSVAYGLRKASPEISLGIGIGLGIFACYKACKATTKIETIIEEHKKMRDLIIEHSDDPEFKDEYSDSDKGHDLFITYCKTGAKMIKLYGPALILGAASISCIVWSHNTMRARNAALAAAYASISKSFKKYSDNVIDRYGKEVDKELRYNIKHETICDTVENADGSEEIVNDTVTTTDDQPIGYAFCFDKSCAAFEPDATSYNEMYTDMQQSVFNNYLHCRKRVFLSEIYEAFGLPHTEENEGKYYAGHIVGWEYKPGDKDHENLIAFDVTPIKKKDVNGRYYTAYIIDFETDGNILEAMNPNSKKKKRIA